MTDQIKLSGLRVRGFHGVFDFERREGQDFVVDVGLGVDTRAAADSDDLRQTVHYGELAEAVAAVISGEPMNLIESVAARIAEVALGFDLVEWVEVTLHKPSAPIPLTFADVAVVVRRTRDT